MAAVTENLAFLDVGPRARFQPWAGACDRRQSQGRKARASFTIAVGACSAQEERAVDAIGFNAVALDMG